MAYYDHLTFLSHSESRPSTYSQIQIQQQQGISSSSIHPHSNNNTHNTSTSVKVDNRLPNEKLFDILDYLQGLRNEKKATIQDIAKACSVDLNSDSELYELVKCNPKIDIFNENGTLYLQYMVKFDVRNRNELLNLIDRIKSGVSLKEISDCYDDVEDDVMEMILSGDIIACSNKEAKDTILYPRGKAFLVPISGTVSAEPGRPYVQTSDDLRSEIRRGDAIKVGGLWFRVSSAVGSKNNQPQRAKAPHSVSSIQELSDRNVYVDLFEENRLPLDGEYDDTKPYKGVALKHGCTNDIRERWKRTLDQFKPIRNEKDLQNELLKLNLISRAGTLSAVRKKAKQEDVKTKKKIKRREVKITNTHLLGTEIGNILASVKSDDN